MTRVRTRPDRPIRLLTTPSAEAEAAAKSKPKRPRKPAKPKRPPSVVAHECAILSLDPATTTGWALLCRGTYRFSGVVTETRSVRLRRITRVMTEARDLAHTWRLPLFVVAETWSMRGWRDPDMALRMAEMFGTWRDVAGELGLPEVIRIPNRTWQGPMLGKNRGSKDNKALAIEICRRLFHVELKADEADACLQGVYAARCPEVGDALRQRRELGL